MRAGSGRSWDAAWLCGGAEFDGVAEGFELPGEPACAGLGVVAAGV